MKFVVFVAGSMLVACGETDSTAPVLVVDPSFARAAPSVPLGITVEDGTAAGPYMVRSDGGGEYIHGLETVIAEIDGFGNLQFRVLVTPTPARTLTIDHSAPFDSGNTYMPSSQGQTNFTIKTSKVNNDNPSLADLGIGSNPASGCYSTTIAYSDGTTSYQSWFNTDVTAGSTFVRISRASTSPSIWTMVADGSCGSTPYSAGLKTQLLSGKKPPLVFRGYYDLRLSIVFRAL
jgi:hypothetical protein